MQRPAEGAALRVESAGYRDIPGWLGLAAEVEPLFGPMLDAPDFYRALLGQIERGTALCVREDDAPPGAPLLGGLLFSPPRSGRPEAWIRWLAVAARGRRRGIGHLLVTHAIGLVAPVATIAVVTFGEDNAPGRPARRFYERLGFVPAEPAPNGPEGGVRQVFRREPS